MKGGDDFLYEEILSYCENNYGLMEKLLIYMLDRLKREREESVK